MEKEKAFELFLNVLEQYRESKSMLIDYWSTNETEEVEELNSEIEDYKEEMKKYLNL